MTSIHEQLAEGLSGRYEIEREIGRGGMATVYLARDIRHDRHVALKVLDPELGAVLGVERFLAEIRVTANLQHPHLLPLFDSGEVGGLLFYVAPFVDGETLRARLEREKQLGIADALRIASAIGEALDHAHRHGVIHRDLKPENILFHEGQPLVADFGIALALTHAGGHRITQTGISLGTPQYMSPEQASGERVIDKRSDIYALGVITYEMLAGEPPHSGATAQAIVARLITEEPKSLTLQRRNVPGHVEDAVHRALEKLPADRWESAREFVAALNDDREQHGAAPRQRHARAASGRGVLVGVAIGAAAMGGMAAARFAWPGASNEAPVEFRIAGVGPMAYREGSGTSLTISPDGQTIAYVGQAGGLGGIILRSLGSTEGKILDGTEGAADIHFSPDGKTIAFYASGRLGLVPIAGGAPTMVGVLVGAEGMSWANDTMMLVKAVDTLWMTNTRTGNRTVILGGMQARLGFSMASPMLLPGGKTLAFTDMARTSDGPQKLGFMRIDGTGIKHSTLAGSNVLGYRDGWLIYGRSDSTISAVKLDPATLTTQGEPVVLVSGVPWKQAGGVSAAFSPGGTLVAARGRELHRLQITDARGNLLAETRQTDNYIAPAWSPDGNRISMSILNGAQARVVVFDAATHTLAALPTRTRASRTGWSPDGHRIAYLTMSGDGAVRVVNADGSGADTVLASSPNENVVEASFAPDGRTVVATISHFKRQSARRDVVLIHLNEPTKTIPFAATDADEFEPAVSPDNRWVAYVSDESGRREVFIRPMSMATGPIKVSTQGAIEPRWLPDGRLVYREPPDVFRAARLAPVGGLTTVSARDTLFMRTSVQGGNHQTYDISPAGHFAMIVNSESNLDAYVTVNWGSRFRELVRGK